MSLRRILILFKQELTRGARGFFFIFSLAMPLILSFVVSALFGSLFAQKPEIAILDQGHSAVTEKFASLDSVTLREYSQESELIQAVQNGVADLGLVLPANFDTALVDGSPTRLDVFVWGGSLLKDRAVLATSLIEFLREINGQEVPVNITTATVGDQINVPWEDRLLPFLVLISIMLGGSILPAFSLVAEKEKRTLTAITVAPPTLNEVFVAKGAVGALVGIVSGLLTLFINQAWGPQPVLLVLVLSLGAIFAAAFGVLIGALLKDVNTLFATTKSMGILLYAPAMFYMFPGLPHWIAKVFPTYYVSAPVLAISQSAAGWSQIAPDVYILLALILLMFALVGWAGRRMQRVEV
jgi:ABC-2 type transport system permease protein